LFFMVDVGYWFTEAFASIWISEIWKFKLMGSLPLTDFELGVVSFFSSCVSFLVDFFPTLPLSLTSPEAFYCGPLYYFSIILIIINTGGKLSFIDFKWFQSATFILKLLSSD